MSGVLTKKFGRKYSAVSYASSSTYCSSSQRAFRHVKYVYDWSKPTLPSACIIAGRVNASARKIVSGCMSCTFPISHSQNASGFVCGLSTRKIRTPWPTQKRKTSRSASQRPRQSSQSKSTLTMSW